MWRVILGIILGMLIGAALGAGVAYSLPMVERSGWTTYPDFRDMFQRNSLVQEHYPLDQYLFSGVIFGLGFGAIVGCLTGAAALISRTLESLINVTAMALMQRTAAGGLSKEK